LTGHQGQITDLDFSPFHDNILATSSADSTLKLWVLPEDGLKESSAKFDANMEGHSRKVMQLKWHPSAEFTIASGSIDGCVKVWDVQKESATFSYEAS
jgi:WD40 repeat protein